MERRIFGYETEYALIISPEAGGQTAPRRMRIYDYIEWLVSTSCRTLPACYRKKGIFLENGGLLNYEAPADNYLEGLVEMATPESTSPREASLYHTAQTNILIDLVKKLNQNIGDFAPGFAGRIFIGKTNVDTSGKCLSSHENYLVEDKIDAGAIPFLAVMAGLFWVLSLILNALSFIPVIILGLIVMCMYLGGIILIHLLKAFPGGNDAADRVFSFLYSSVFEELVLHQLVKITSDISRILFTPWIRIYTWLVSPYVLTRFKSELVPFLVTRTIFTGSGRVSLPSADTAPGPTPEPHPFFEISQRADAIKTICTIYFDDGNRPLIDMRDLFYNPLSALHRRKRLHMLFSDTNMSSIGVYLKLGITGLVLEMIEEGHTFRDLYPADPIKALKDISRDTSLKLRIPLADGGEATAIEIQRHYLARAQEFFRERAMRDPQIRDILERWEYVLSCLEANPHLLYKKVDWVTKKDLVEEVMRGRCTIDELAEVSEWVSYISTHCGAYSPLEMDSPDLLRHILGEENYQAFLDFLVYRELTVEQFISRWTIYQELIKIDFKFHQLDEEGYYYQMLHSGLVDELFTSSEVAWAATTPPGDTRAYIRGELIKKYGQKKTAFDEADSSQAVLQSIKIGWDKFYIRWPWKKVEFKDPFNTDLTGTEKELER
ncbi:MAG: proteasome accessory factor PafA2 family protein [Candidatus Xenobiia bacterium LiM19]